MTEPDISYANMGKAYKMGSSQEARKHCLLTAYPKRTCWVGQGERSSRLPWGCDGWAWILEGGSWRSLGKERRQENPKQKEWHEQSLLIGGSMVDFRELKRQGWVAHRSTLCCGHRWIAGLRKVQGADMQPCSTCQARVPWAAVSAHREGHLFSSGAAQKEHLYLIPSKVPWVLSAWCLDHSKREKERDQVRLERQPDLKPPSVGLYPKDNEKLMGFKCVCVWWTDLHFEKITPVAAWKTD